MHFSKSEIEEIRSIGLFSGLDQHELVQITEASRRQKFDAGSYVFFESDPADKIYLIFEGQIKLLQTTQEGQQVILSYLTPGSAFGIIASLGDMEYPVTAQAVVDSVVIYWDKHNMSQLLNKIPRLSINALRIFSKKIIEFQDRIRELSTERVERRIARTLLRLGRQIGHLTPEGVLIDLPVTREDLGNMTGTTLFTISRTFSKWEALGLISCNREKVTIKSPHGLVKIAEDLLDQV